MKTAATMDEINQSLYEKIGSKLAAIREERGYSLEFVASRLHLRVQIIQLIENCAFNLLPQPVFVKGYLRAYAKLLGISADPYVTAFEEEYVVEHKTERTLRQSKKQTYRVEYLIRWGTLVCALGVVLAVGVWWQNGKDEVAQHVSMKDEAKKVSTNDKMKPIKLTDISKLHALLKPKSQMTMLDAQGG